MVRDQKSLGTTALHNVKW